MRFRRFAGKHLGQLRRPKLIKTALWARALVILAGGTLSTFAQSHLMSAGLGTVNIRQDDVVVLICLPASALKDVDDNLDGLLQPDEIRRHQDAILQQIRRGFSLTIDGIEAKVSEEYLLVSVHVDDQQSTSQIEWWSRLVFEPSSSPAAACVVLKLDWFLPEKSADEQTAYGIQITLNAVNERVQFTQSHSSHRVHCEVDGQAKH